MNHGSTREAAGYRRSFVVRGRSAWFAYVRLNHATSLPGGAYEVRSCPTWAEAYTWACAKVDRCAVCGRPSNDHGGWNHAYASGVAPLRPDSATGQYSRCTRGCNDHTGHALGPGCYQYDYPAWEHLIPNITAPDRFEDQR
jgi:hypothetical protein